MSVVMSLKKITFFSVIVIAMLLLSLAAVNIASAGHTPQVIDLAVDPADLTVLGESTSQLTRSAIASGDFNNDGFDDLLLGALMVSQGSTTQAGEAYVVFGGPGATGVIDLQADEEDLRVLGTGSTGHLGAAGAAGDLNNDGVDDLIIASDHKVYVIFGIDVDDGGIGGTIDLGTHPAGVTISA
ncbi:MAG: FG-GAP repeat protein, partial [Chloroflexi bacterium]|nr:FG-GAP repeat protein [Chloroflexota bacterium]